MLSGKKHFAIDIESHGRNYTAQSAPPDLSIGWLTAIFPFVIHDAEQDIDKLANCIKFELNSIPHRGVGYLFNQYIVGTALCKERLKDLCFNFLGQFCHNVTMTQLLPELSGLSSAPLNCRPYVIEVNALIAKNCLEIQISYDESIFPINMIENFITLTKSELERLVKKYWPIKNATSCANSSIKLGPMQQNLLTVFNENDYSLHFNIATWNFSGPINIALYRSSWEQVCSFYELSNYHLNSNNLCLTPKKLSRQYFHCLDWTNLSSGEQNQKWTTFIENLQNTPLDLQAPPLLDLYIIKITGNAHKVVMKMHQLLLDGWSINQFFAQLSEYYVSNLNSNQGKTRNITEIQKYFIWQDSFAPPVVRKAFWCRYKNSWTYFKMPQKLNKYCYGMEIQPLSTKLEEQLTYLYRNSKLSLSHFYLVAWTLFQCAIRKCDNIVIGIMDANRKIEEYPDAEHLIGMLSSMLPFSIKVNPDQSFLSFWENIQKLRVEMNAFSNSSLDEIANALGQQSPGLPFAATFNFQNYPQQQDLFARMGNVQIHDLQVLEKTHIPLGLRVILNSNATDLKLSYQTDLYSRHTAQKLLNSFHHLLVFLQENTKSTLNEIIRFLVEVIK